MNDYEKGIKQGMLDVYNDLLFRDSEFEKRTDETAEEYKAYAKKLRLYAEPRIEFLNKVSTETT